MATKKGRGIRAFVIRAVNKLANARILIRKSVTKLANARIIKQQLLNLDSNARIQKQQLTTRDTNTRIQKQQLLDSDTNSRVVVRQKMTTSSKSEYYDTNGEFIGLTWHPYYTAQTFTIGSVGPAETFEFNKIRLRLQKSGSPTGTLTVSIYNTNGSNIFLPGIISTGSIDYNEISTTEAWYEIAMSPVTMYNGNQYALAIEIPNTNGSNKIGSRMTLTGSKYPGGIYKHTANAGADLYPNGRSAYDLYFEIYGDSYPLSDARIQKQQDSFYSSNARLTVINPMSFNTNARIIVQKLLDANTNARIIVKKLLESSTNARIIVKKLLDFNANARIQKQQLADFDTNARIAIQSINTYSSNARIEISPKDIVNITLSISKEQSFNKYINKQKDITKYIDKIKNFGVRV